MIQQKKSILGARFSLNFRRVYSLSMLMVQAIDDGFLLPDAILLVWSVIVDVSHPRYLRVPVLKHLFDLTLLNIVTTSYRLWSKENYYVTRLYTV